MARVLGVGVATIDLIFSLPRYPVEDSEQRAQDLRRARGGNAANLLEVLALLGHRCHWAGVLPADADGVWIEDRLREAGIGLSPACRRVAGARAPLSSIWLGRASGSRTIVHYRDCPELGLADLQRESPTAYDWIHFEGRQPDETHGMLQWVRRQAAPPGLSLEVEKDRPGIERLLPLADLLLFSRAFARCRGFDRPEQLAAWARKRAPAADLVLAWGDQGAWAWPAGGGTLFAPASPPPVLVDTLGAGDVFNAALVHGRLAGRPLDEALESACRLAGRKCGQWGFQGLTE